ncbi:hypothetical protein EDD11_001816 [Mortierella claussenii]|nr:hypothetical protein EDD11_001816 [Mortierella claussenii]
MEWRPNLTLQSGAADGAGGSRTLLSLRNFPQESDLATMYSAYFVSYLICDLMLGMVHYRAYLDPLSGWAHHLGYMGVISTATLQKSVPAFMAMGAPIEVSTIFLASGHIFPKLRSDILFATTFFLSRIVYPIVLLPELYLNVESRLGLKVVLMALMVHIHWFRKFVQQQMRYYRERQGAKTSDDTAIPTASMAAPEKQILLDDIENNIELQWTRSITSEQVKANHCGSRRSSNSSTGSNGSDTASSRIYSRTPSFDHDILVTQPCEPLNDSEADTDADSDDAHPSPRPATLKFDTPIFSTVSNTAPGTAKIIQQLLKECDQDGFSAYARSMKGAIGGGNNKTFSAMALKKLMSSQGSSASGPGAVRLSRPLSMRDTKRRIALDEVRFEDPRVKSGKDSMALERPKEAKEDQDLDATVVLRRPSPRASVVVQEDKEFGTIRVLSSRQST